MPHYIAFVTDPTLKDDTLVFSVRDVKNQVQARHAIVNKYEQNGWPYDGISIRLAALRSQQVQHLGHTRADPDVEAIRALCEEVLHIASNEPMTQYADKLRTLVQSFAIGKQAYESYYYGSDQNEL